MRDAVWNARIKIAVLISLLFFLTVSAFYSYRNGEFPDVLKLTTITASFFVFFVTCYLILSTFYFEIANNEELKPYKPIIFFGGLFALGYTIRSFFENFSYFVK